MNNTIHIPEPCHEKWALMKDAGNKQRHCDVCKTNVHDFTKSSLSEIHSKIKEAGESKLCGRYHERHTTTTNKAYLFANYIEDKLMKINFKRASVFLVAIVLVISGCARKCTKGRRLQGKFLAPNKETAKEMEIKTILNEQHHTYP
jgi:hypothetical protein